jgi:hypothetical protein
VGKWLMSASALQYTVILVVTIVSGLLLENAGSRLEHILERNKLHKRAWSAYLRSGPNSKVGHAYISSVVTRMKFELAMPFALVIGAGGVATIAFFQSALANNAAWSLIAVALLAAVWLAFEASDSIKLLNQTRRRTFSSAERLHQPTPSNLPPCH